MIGHIQKYTQNILAHVQVQVHVYVYSTTKVLIGRRIKENKKQSKIYFVWLHYLKGSHKKTHYSFHTCKCVL